jgi:copper chaperone CopZ
MHCAHTIKMELGDLDGVESVAVDVEKKEVSLKYSAPATTESIETLLAEINYPVEKTL